MNRREALRFLGGLLGLPLAPHLLEVQDDLADWEHGEEFDCADLIWPGLADGEVDLQRDSVKAMLVYGDHEEGTLRVWWRQRGKLVFSKGATRYEEDGWGPWQEGEFPPLEDGDCIEVTHHEPGTWIVKA